MKLTEVSVSRPILVSVIYLGIAVFGVVAFLRLPIDLLPDVETPVLSVVTVYPGGGAEDVEAKISEPLEDELGTLEGLDETQSISKDNVSVVVLRFEYGTDLDEAANDVRTRLEAMRGRLPPDAERPVVHQFSTGQFPVLAFGITAEEGDVRRWREEVRTRILDPLSRLEGVGSVQVWNAPEEKVFAEVSLARLQSYGLSLEQVGRALALENLSVPAGSLEAGAMELALSVDAELGSLDDVRQVVVGQGPAGLVRLGDVASLRRGFAEPTETAAVNLEPALVARIVKRSGANTVAVVARIKERLAELEPTLPPGLHATVVADNAKFIQVVIRSLGLTLLVAGLLVVLVVFVFLRHLRPSVVVAMAIPASMIGAVLVLWAAGFTINVVSLMAMALAVGMVVDNAIVVLESAVRHLESGLSPREAAILGTREVGPPVIASTLTTVSVFAPLVFISGFIGLMFEQLAWVITATVGASLVVALTLTPMLVGLLLRPARQQHEGTAGRGVLRALNGLDSGYREVVRWALGHRALVVVGALVLLAGTGFAVRMVGMDFLPIQNAGTLRVAARMPVGTRMEVTAEVGRRIGEIARAVPGVRAVMYRAGVSESAAGLTFGDQEGSNIVTATVDLLPSAKRDLTDPEIVDRLRAGVSRLPQIEQLEVDSSSTISSMLGIAKPLVIHLSAAEFPELREGARILQRVVAATRGAVDVSADLLQTRPDVRYVLDRDRAALSGVPAARIADALRTASSGRSVTRYRGEGEDLDVVLRLRPEDRADLASLGSLEVASLAGPGVRLSDVGRFEAGATPLEIRHRDRQREATVSAGVKGRPLGDVVRDIEAALAAERLPPGLEVRFGGDVREMRSAFKSVLFALVMGLLLVYLVMAGQFESLVDPFVIAFSIPFAITGAFLFLLLTGTTLSLISAVGLVLLLGIVVNNAIVLVDYVNLLRREQGMGMTEALVTAGERRLRPVLMTTLTTMMGMLPLALARGEGSELWIPMGRAALGGLLVSTMVTLVLVPVGYAMLEPLRRRRAG